VYACEKTIKDAGDKIKAEDKKLVEDKIASLKDAQKNDNIDDIKAKTKDLSEIIQKIGAELYKNQPQQPPQEGGEKKDGEAKNEPKAEEGKYTEK